MPIKPFENFRGAVLPLDRANVDTDAIIPKQFLKRVERTGFGEFLFYDWIRDGEIELEPNPILVTGKNFGCGSSREHAPIALGSADCKVVLAESFARIFFRNCVATGELYPCELTERLVDTLNTGDEISVDLDSGKIQLLSSQIEHSFKPLGDVRPVVDAGGIFNYARQTGMIASS